MSMKPTDEQLKAAWQLVIDTVASDRFAGYMDDLECGCAADLLAPVVARALAAAVTAEREKYLQVADELEQEARQSHGGEVDGMYRAARRIREVSR